MKTKRHFDVDIIDDDDGTPGKPKGMDDEGTGNERFLPRLYRRFNDGVRDVAKQIAHEILGVVWTMRSAGQRADDEAGVVWDDATVRGLVRGRGVRGGLGDGCREVSDGVSRRAVREIPGRGGDGRVVRGLRRRSKDDAI